MGACGGAGQNETACQPTGCSHGSFPVGDALLRIAAAADMITRTVRQETHTPRRRTFVAVDDVRVMSA